MLAEYSNLDPKYFEYPNDVLAGKYVTSEWIKLACKRYLDWFDRPEYYFDAAKVDKVVNFV